MQSHLRTYFKGEHMRTEKPLPDVLSKFKEKDLEEKRNLIIGKSRIRPYAGEGY